MPLQGTTYRAPFSIDLVHQMEGLGHTQRLSKRLGQLPIMVKSKACYLRHLSRRELVKLRVGGWVDGTGLGGGPWRDMAEQSEELRQ